MNRGAESSAYLLLHGRDQIARLPGSVSKDDHLALAELLQLSVVELERQLREGSVVIGSLASVWKAALARRGAMPFAIHGRSMVPTLVPGEQVWIVPTREFSPGMIVLAAIDGRLVLHRIVEMDRDGVVTRGDNCPEPDARLARLALIGRAERKHIRLGARLSGAWYYLRRRKWRRLLPIMRRTWTRRLA